MLAIVAFDIAVALALIIIHDVRIRSKEKRRAKELARIKAEQIKQHKMMLQCAEEQKVLSKEQERQAKEQERQAKELAKHEEQIAKLEFTVSKAQFDIDYLSERVANLDAMRDNLMAQQCACTPTSKGWDKLQRKILTLDNQIHSAESRLGKAQFSMAQAKAKMMA